jgi:dihydropteroate synthase
MTGDANNLAQRVRAARDERRPLVMGIINVTPDSFSDGGRFEQVDQAVAHGLRLAEEGADILDVGGESTRPGATAVGIQEELDRILPVIEGLVARTAVPISIDTSKPAVMQAAVDVGALMINDVNGLRSPGALEMAATLKVPVCVMHMQGEPRTMQVAPDYDDVVADVREFLAGRIDACLAAGIDRDFISIDPGFGFGKTLAHNIELLRRLGELSDLGAPLLVGISRKSMLGTITGRNRADQRVAASVAAAILAAQGGAAIVRVHDVADTVDALKVTTAVLGSSVPGPVQ